MHRAKKVVITDLNQHLTCKLCKGYFIDATTIIECLHSFCRSCIVKYLETNKYCPVCDVQVHKTKPLLNIRADRTLQDIVYKLVPRLFQNEIQRRRDFYQAHPEAKAHQDRIEDNYHHILAPDESISLTLCYHGCKESARYLRCPAAVSVAHLQKLIRAKYGLFDNHHVDILYNQDCLNSSLTLMDVAYIYSWKRKAPIELTYRIYQYTAKKPKLEDKVEEKSEAAAQNNNNWKEVQLRISENGEMSIIQDETLELVNNNNYKPEIVTVVDNKVTKNELPELKYNMNKCASIPETLSATSVSLSSSTTTKTVYSTINSSKCSVSSDSDTKKPEEKPKSDLKRKLDVTSNEQPIKQQKQTILNHSIGLHNLSNNHPLKKHAQQSQLNKIESVPQTGPEKAEEFPKPTIINKNLNITPITRPGTPKPISKPCYMPKPVINVPKPSTSLPKVASQQQPPPQTCSSVVSKQEIKTTPTPTTNQNQNKLIKSKASTPIGYKTLRDPPKSWNSQIAKANVNKPLTEPKYGDLKNVRPAKFFKMRNNMPRYLGNPASGVKPMYQVHVSPEKDKEKAMEAPPVSKGEIKKHSIVKIDPKTLKPISEKAPETTSLSNSSSDLKINTSSVSIFNPLKLQNSPKSDRKSPKSPHSPKTKSSSPSNKRDKLNLNFTPSNPFIPNLASPTVSPNQFLYPSGPPGFPPYDPRVMAAYHHMLYGQRMAFPAGLSLDLNQRKGFDLAGPTSPKLGGMPQPHSPQQPPLKLPNADQLGIQSISSSRPNSINSNNNTTAAAATTTTTASNSSAFKAQPAPKKSSKESTGKSEKSLQNAVEKLTQNRVKEIKNEAAAVNVAKTTTAPITVTATTTAATTTTTKKDEERKQEEKSAPANEDNQAKVEEANSKKEDSNGNGKSEKTTEDKTLTVSDDKKKD